MKKPSALIILLLVLLIGTNSVWAVLYFQGRNEGKTWVMVDSWTGESTPPYNYTTSDFRITGEEWAACWTWGSTSSSDVTEVSVYDAYSDDLLTVLAFDSAVQERYLSFKGRFYLEVQMYGGFEDWSLRVEEYR